jgi:hypothetical protein
VMRSIYYQATGLADAHSLCRPTSFETDITKR